MSRRQYVRVLTICTFGFAILIGCGSSNPAGASSPTPTQPVPAPPTAQAPQYEAAMLDQNKPDPDHVDLDADGQIFMNANGVSGAGKIQISGVPPNLTYTITFEPFGSPAAAIPLGTAASDANGNVNATFTFPQKGTFAGIFNMQTGVDANGLPMNQLGSGVDNVANFVFNVPLQLAGKVAPAIPDHIIGTDPLSSGIVTAGGGHIHVELRGALPNAQYSLGACGVGDGSSCSGLSGLFSTDASGNGTLDAAVRVTGNGDNRVIIEVFRGDDLEYVTGFTVQ